MKISTLKEKEVKRLFKEGKKIRGVFIAARFIESGEKVVGVGASAKVSSKPRKNRIKKRLRELLRLNWDILPDYHIFMVGQGVAAEVEWEKLEEDFLKLVKDMKNS